METILLVDDDPLIIKLYELILKKMPYTILIAVDAREMWKIIAAQKPDIILLDVVLPDEPGFELCIKIKTNPNLRNIKVILVSGTEVAPDKIAEGIDIGADDYLRKPFHPKELAARVRSCLKLKKAEDELWGKNLELKRLSQHLQTVREDERRFFAKEVQEEVGQLTAVIKMEIDWLARNMQGIEPIHKRRFDHASDMALEIIHRIRKIASSLRPSMLDELGLHASLTWLCKQNKRVNGANCHLYMENEEAVLPPELVTAIFRICQELLIQIQLQSDAKNIAVKAVITATEVQLCIEDDGNGFDVSQQKTNPELIAIRERVQAVNGVVAMQNLQAAGTKIDIAIPR